MWWNEVRIVDGAAKFIYGTRQDIEDRHNSKRQELVEGRMMPSEEAVVQKMRRKYGKIRNADDYSAGGE